ncbi:MAG: hypothetical protein NW220_05015 [Leptolyngbyaceae cyanobacterium bins.349]|nr:hypothetical protein [Leptolyngbyaceae cyanobacterium bins.349]
MQEHHAYRPTQDVPASPRNKRLGGYLVDAGLLTPAQVDMALNDQKSTGMRLGEILAARGWVKQQTIEYLMQKVILPEQAAERQQVDDREQPLVNNKQMEDLDSSTKTGFNDG